MWPNKHTQGWFTGLLITTGLIVLLSQAVIARETTLPPSIALRTEVSYVNIVLLESAERVDQQQTNLHFSLIKNLHNTAAEKIDIRVTNLLAADLEVGAEYIIAYETVRKVRDNEAKHYIRIANGPELMRVQGAYPAIFRRNESLVDRLLSDPQEAVSDPDALIQTIFSGMADNDPVIKAFFVREIVNWNALYPYLKPEHYSALLAALVSPNANAGTKIAILELRKPLNQGIGIDQIGQHARGLLSYMSVNMDPIGEGPALILNALLFLEAYQLTAEWDMLSRWTQTNIPTIAERAVLMLKRIDENRAQTLIQQRLKDSLLNVTTRRMLERQAKPRQVLH